MTAAQADGNSVTARVSAVFARLFGVSDVHLRDALAEMWGLNLVVGEDRHDLSLYDKKYGRCHFHRTIGRDYDNAKRWERLS